MNWNFDFPISIQGIPQPQTVKNLIQSESYDPNLVALVCAEGQTIADKEIQIFDLVADAIKAVGKIKTSLICVPAYQVLDASLEAISSEVEQLIILTPNVPPLDTIKILQVATANNVLVLGPGSSGILVPEKYCLGTLRQEYFGQGNIALIGHAQALIYEVAWALNQAKIGQSLVISLGTDKIIGSNLIRWLELLDEDDGTAAIAIVQSAPDIDYNALELLSKSTKKPVICYVAGSQTPTEQVFRKGIAIVNNYLSNSIPTTNSYRKMMSTIKKSGAKIAEKPSEIPSLLP